MNQKKTNINPLVCVYRLGGDRVVDFVAGLLAAGRFMGAFGAPPLDLGAAFFAMEARFAGAALWAAGFFAAGFLLTPRDTGFPPTVLIISGALYNS